MKCPLVLLVLVLIHTNATASPLGVRQQEQDGEGAQKTELWTGGVGVGIVVVLYIFMVMTCVYCYRKRKSNIDEEEISLQPLKGTKDEKGEFELSEFPPKKRLRLRVPLPKNFLRAVKSRKTKSHDRSHPEPATVYRKHPSSVDRKIQARDNFLRTEQEYENAEIVKSPECGSRMQKLWTQLKLNETAVVGASKQQDVYLEQMMSVMPLSHQCRIYWLNRKTANRLRKLLELLQGHPFIHPILRIAYDADTRQVVLTQPYVRSGSLKDSLYQHCKPSDSWESKYKDAKQKLPTAKKIGLYGRQILETLLFLYGTEKWKGFSSLGHVQSGNVFLDGSRVCRLGGYENTLLGYKTRLHKLFKDNMDHIDLFMFGHLIFEMTCGYELTTTAPTSEDFATVAKRSKEVQEVMKFIFKPDGPRGFPSIAEVQQLSLFWNVELPELSKWNEQKSKATEKMSKLLYKLLN